MTVAACDSVTVVPFAPTAVIDTPGALPPAAVMLAGWRVMAGPVVVAFGTPGVGVNVAVVELPWLNRVDPAWLAGIVAGKKRLYLIEDHYPALGQSAFITQALCTSGIAIPTRIWGVDAIPECGQIPEVLAHHRLDAGSLAARISSDE